jgi:hypothetical protein
LHEREQRVREREAHRGQGEPSDERAVLVGHGRVEEAAEQQGRDGRGDRRAHHRCDKCDQKQAVRAAEREHASQHVPIDALRLELVGPPETHHCAVIHHAARTVPGSLVVAVLAWIA